MISWFLRGVERAKENEAFRQLHEAIAFLNAKVETLSKQNQQLRMSAENPKPIVHIKHLDDQLSKANKDLRKAKAYIEQLEQCARNTKTKRHIQNVRDNKLLKRLREYVGDAIFMKFASEVNKENQK